MAEYLELSSIKGECTMSQGFIAQYAAEAALQVEGVAQLDTSVLIGFKEAIGGEHEGKGVKVSFRDDQSDAVNITVYPIVYYGYKLPEIAWDVQEGVKNDVEKYTGVNVDSVNVYVKGVVRKGK